MEMEHKLLKVPKLTILEPWHSASLLSCCTVSKSCSTSKEWNIAFTFLGIYCNMLNRNKLVQLRVLGTKLFLSGQSVSRSRQVDLNVEYNIDLMWNVCWIKYCNWWSWAQTWQPSLKNWYALLKRKVQKFFFVSKHRDSKIWTFVP
jgi:hypothetical protein